MKHFKIISAFLISFFTITAPIAVLALDYQILAPIGNLSTELATKNDLSTYVNFLFKLGIGAAGVLAVIYIIIGGAQYSTTDSILGHQKGKETIKRALTGLALAIFSWLILSTINPDLLSLKFFSYDEPTEPQNTTSEPVGAPTTPINPAQDTSAATASGTSAPTPLPTSQGNTDSNSEEKLQVDPETGEYLPLSN
ncbi:MAG: pilin [Candidatus Paceibacterota bacterium]|jgi:hypothetical protein